MSLLVKQVKLNTESEADGGVDVRRKGKTKENEEDSSQSSNQEEEEAMKREKGSNRRVLESCDNESESGEEEEEEEKDGDKSKDNCSDSEKEKEEEEEEEEKPKKKAKVSTNKKSVAQTKKENKEKGKRKGKNQKEKQKDPNYPKRNMNSYMFFNTTKIAENKAKGSKLPFTQQTAGNSRTWKGMTDEEKKPYEEQALADKRRFKRELEEKGYEIPKSLKSI